MSFHVRTRDTNFTFLSKISSLNSRPGWRGSHVDPCFLEVNPSVYSYLQFVWGKST